MPVDPEKEISLKQNLEQVGPETTELFNETFLREHSDYRNFSDFLSDLGGYRSENQIPYDLTIGDADEIVQENTDFNSWFEMLNEALGGWWEEDGKDRRRHERHPCDIDVTIEVGSDEIEATIQDISKSGVRIKTHAEIPHAQFMKIHVPMKALGRGTGTMVLRGAIRWRTEDESPFSFGLEILSKWKPSG